MTVGELMDILRGVDQNLDVFVEVIDEGDAALRSVFIGMKLGTRDRPEFSLCDSQDVPDAILLTNEE